MGSCPSYKIEGTVGRAGGQGEAEESSQPDKPAVSVCVQLERVYRMGNGTRAGTTANSRGMGRGRGIRPEAAKELQVRGTKGMWCPGATGRWHSQWRTWAGTPALPEKPIGRGATEDAGGLGESSVREWWGSEPEEQASGGVGGEEV